MPSFGEKSVTYISEQNENNQNSKRTNFKVYLFYRVRKDLEYLRTKKFTNQNFQKVTVFA